MPTNLKELIEGLPRRQRQAEEEAERRAGEELDRRNAARRAELLAGGAPQRRTVISLCGSGAGDQSLVTEAIHQDPGDYWRGLVEHDRVLRSLKAEVVENGSGVTAVVRMPGGVVTLTIDGDAGGELIRQAIHNAGAAAWRTRVKRRQGVPA